MHAARARDHHSMSSWLFISWCIILALHAQMANAQETPDELPKVRDRFKTAISFIREAQVSSIADDVIGLSRRSSRARSPSLTERRRFQFSLPENTEGSETEEDPNCFIEVMAPKRIGGRCGVTGDGKTFCGTRGYTYMNHPQCTQPPRQRK
ncbi:hypothetical protein CAPTEDRAFT_199234 [Capitella teleta]|uniref:Uncharacterized protein n=1 Tax=Capitella teleta TaxID=283909 RepID=R7T331_CAPTE|nr:hypothetical protein CAPTEDRAFT_199234 [Capitella teleta]|eukprot:ELT87037.1 hypothetical protein CAPTEDRAFT_199234 [Capitella teleta]